MLLRAYAMGIFPMAQSRDDPDVDWYYPEQRGVLPLDGLHVPRRLARRIRQRPFEIRSDTAFRAVVQGCADRGAHEGTWINEAILRGVTHLHRLGLAHSVEAWLGEVLVGGLYGVALGGAFFAESMFHRADAGGTDASKICLVHLVESLRAGGFALLDVQMVTPITARFGAIEVPADELHARLAEAIQVEARWPGVVPVAPP